MVENNQNTEDVVVRAGRPSDGADVADMANALNREMGLTNDPFTAETVARDGFGEDPAFSLLIAEAEGDSIGYALFTEGYNTDFAARGLWLDDIYVAPPYRSRGIGRKLMAAVAATARQRNFASMWWTVLDSNARAIDFYREIGAIDDNARLLELHGPALEKLARETAL